MQLRRRALELRVADTTGLVPPRPDRVEADEVCSRTDVLGLGRLPLPLELAPGAGEPRREGVGNVVVAGDREYRCVEALEKRRGPLVLITAAAIRQVATCDHDLRADPLDQRSEAPLQDRVVPRAEMEVGDVQDASSHRRSRLYSECDGRRAVDGD